MNEEQKKAIFTRFLYPFLSRGDSSDPGCITGTNGSKDWLQTNFGQFSVYAPLEDLQKLNVNFSSFESLELLTPSQAAQLTLTSGALNDTTKITAIFQVLLVGDALENVDAFLTTLSAAPEIPDIAPPVRDFVMNSTFQVISVNFLHFDVSAWISWFQVKLIPILPSFTTVMLTQTTAQANCTNYHVIVRGMGIVFEKMPLTRRKGIANVLVQHLKQFSATFSEIACRLDIQNDAQWLEVNLGPFAKEVDYSALKELNITGLATLDLLSPEQKAELVLDPSTGALENVTVLKEVFVSVTASPEVEQLDDFFQTFVIFTIQQNITYITNTAVRDTMLNLTLTALAPRFPTFQPSDFTLWFQVNLAVLLVSIRPASLNVIPMNISCDSLKAIIGAFDESLKTLPPGVSADLQSSRDYLEQRLPPGCTPPPPPVDVCAETVVDEESLCANASSISEQDLLASVNSTGTLCNFSMGDLACSSLESLSADGLATLLECKLPNSNSYPKETWKAFFVKVAGILDEALLQYSGKVQNLTLSVPTVLEVIREVKLNNLTEAQLKDKAFISQWFNIRLGPFLPSVTPKFLTCLTNQSFSCETFQAVVAALSNRSTAMNEEQKKAIFTRFLYPFLSRGDSSDPGCITGTMGSKDWLQTNFGQFSVYAPLEDLQKLNVNFSSFESLELLTPSQAAQLTLTSGALNDTTKITAIFQVLLVGDALENVDAFLTTLSAAPEIPDIAPPVRDFVMNSTFQVISVNFLHFDVSAWISWFQVKLIPILPSFTTVMLTQTTAQANCTNYQVIVKGMGIVFEKMPLTRRKGIANVLVQHLKQFSATFSEIACRLDIQNDAQWLEVNLGPFAKEVDYSALKELNITGASVISSFTAGQKAEFILDSSNGATQDESLVGNIVTSLLESNDESQLTGFFTSVNNIAVEKNLTAIPTGVRDIVLNLTLTGLAPKFHYFSPENFALWFQNYLVLFLPSIDPTGLAVIPTNISCDSYREIVKGFNSVFAQLSVVQSENIFSFNKQYMMGQSTGLSCVQSVGSDKDWILKNFGQFSIFAPYTDLLLLKSDFNGVEAREVLTETQLSELASIPGQLKSPEDVQKVMAEITPTNFAAFFNVVSPAIEKLQDNYTVEVKAVFLQAIFDRGNLSSPSVPDLEIVIWVNVLLRPLLNSLSIAQVAPYFSIIKDRSCNISQEGINALDSSHSSLTSEIQKEIEHNIQLLLKGPTPVRCYSGGSFYIFLKSTFLNFGFPDLSNFLSLIPSDRQPEILNSIKPSELNAYLSQPSVITNSSDLCIVLSNYNKTLDYLELVTDPQLQQQILPCVWSLALSAATPDEAERWFDVALKNYLNFLTKDLISVSFIQKASCLSHRKLVSIMGSSFNYSTANFTQSDVYASIKAYLTQDGTPRCYNATVSELNSTAWFVDYIGPFISYASVSDLQSFCSSSQLGVFLENPANLQLFGNSTVSSTVASYFITQLYTLNPTFSPVSLPGNLLCLAPVSAYEDLGKNDSLTMLDSLKLICNGTEPEISAALVANLPQLSADTIKSLGNESTSLTVGQISQTSSSVLVSSLSTLSVVSGWNQGQVNAIIQSITQTMQITTAATLVSLGTLIQGVPTTTISSITSTQLLTTISNTVFINNMLTAPTTVQQTYIKKIISIDQSITQLMVNVPNALAGFIPRVLLTSSNLTIVSQLNQKTWKPQQAVMFFDTVASAVDETEELSQSVLQGFSCSSVQTISKMKVQRLIRACRPRLGRPKVVLGESQLTCMYNYEKSIASQNFTEYPTDMLLYFSYDQVDKANCKSYFQALSSADFSVISSGLSIKTTLWNNAKSCLGITGFNLSSEDVGILGNMMCTLDGTYIQNSDPAILEKLKNCPDFTDAQVSAIETLLFTRNTTYGNSSTWNQQTLQDLGILPLYLTQTFWDNFSTSEKRAFLRSFLPSLRSQKVQKRKLRRLFRRCNSQFRRRFLRGAGCVLGNITESTVNDPSFPFGYDATQFDLCLDLDILKNNLATVTERVDDEDFQTIVLAKLNQAYPEGLKDSELQLLGSTARVATTDDISKWNITLIDTLAALMNTDDGEWNTTMSKAVIMKYLSTAKNTLGSNEINTIGSNLCGLDTSVLSNITSASLKDAETVDLSSCSGQQKTALYTTAKVSFISVRQQRSTRASTSYYQLISQYLGGAPLADIRSLAAENVSMDITTFLTLNLDVIKNLSVSEVLGLLGSININDLKTFENNSIIQAWITEQLQSELDKLGLGLTGGKASVATVTATPLANATNDASNTNTTTTTATTTVDPSTNRGDVSHQNSLALRMCVLLISLLMLH
ncbi:uncharacterized protein LOC143124782 [Alosa pseudoharengus]|uniref:uncharacterized protein LOC143124782 n=1 Tax=Alosa pseudoharengus TaxID=34774 RepID=UPI003F8CBABA